MGCPFTVRYVYAIAMIARAALATGCVTDAGSAPTEPPAEAPAPVSMSIEAQRFLHWVDASVRPTDPAVAGLYYAYFAADTQRPWFLSPMVSADVLRFALRIGDNARAIETGEALLRWQHPGTGSHGGRLKGAFPSEIAQTDGTFAARYLYDTSDTLVICEALLDLYTATDDARYLDAARAGGAWLRDVMMQGQRYGVWLAPLGAPMKAVTDEGDFDNRIDVGRTLFALPTLRRLATLAGEPSFAAIADAAHVFLLRAQTASGGFDDHYDPGYPPKAFDASRFQPYGADGSVVADDSLRAAMGALAAGDRAAAEAFVRWLPQTGGRVPGYLTLATGEPHFPPGNTPYTDVISSALYGHLVARLGIGTAPGFARSLQATNGGWYWGAVAADDTPINADQSTLTGVWTLMDLSPGSVVP